MLAYCIDFATDTSLFYQPIQESNNLGNGCLKFYTSLKMCVSDAFHVNSVSLVHCTKTKYLTYKGTTTKFHGCNLDGI